jgi:YggT family protein
VQAYLIQFISVLSTVLYVALLARVLSSWINVGPTSPFFPILRMIHQVTEPILAPIRRVLPKMGMLDFSPMVALILLTVIRGMVTRFLTA